MSSTSFNSSTQWTELHIGNGNSDREANKSVELFHVSVGREGEECYNKWVAHAGVAFFLPFTFLWSSRAPPRGETTPSGGG
ncbi:hypothetical protein ACLKA7_013962 [Drosophila subpalustris]